MNILFFHNNGIIPTFGGISRTTFNLCNLFRKKGHIVWFLGARRLHDVEYDKQQLFLPNNILDNSSENVEFISDFIRKHDIDIIINQSAYNLNHIDLLYNATCDLNIKIVTCYHNSILTPIYNYAYQKEFLFRRKNKSLLFHFFRFSIINKIMVYIYIKRYRFLYKYAEKKSHAIVLLTEGQKEEWKRMTGNEDTNKIEVIYNCVPDDISNCTHKDNIILWVGTFDYAVKRPDLVLLAWSKIQQQYPDWKMQLLGDGPSLNTMKRYANEIGAKRVEFVGRVNPSSFYSKAKILCVTSTHESFSLVSVEAIKNNMNVIMFNSFTSAPLITDNGNVGELITPFDINKYALSLSKLINNDKYRIERNIKAKKHIKIFSENNIYDKWMQLFCKL